MALLDKFLDFVSFDTQSSETTGTTPSTPGQLILAAHLVDVMKDIGINDAHMDEYGYVYGSIPGNIPCGKKIGFLAHMDTSAEISGKDVKPRVIENYDGKDIVLNESLGIVTDLKNFPSLENYKGKTIVVTDGTTLLGCDDKAGISIILQACEEIIEKDLPHGDVKIAFTPDEEIGEGPNHFDVPGFGADFAYTIDGGALGEVEYENFNGSSASVKITGRSVHPGSAKNKMINAMTVAMEFHSMLPANEVPEHTDGYDGFSHLVEMHGDIESAELHYIIRDHDKDLLDKKADRFLKIADYLNAKYDNKPVEVNIKESYLNMKEMILPHMYIMELAKEAMVKNGVQPITMPIRGGTDGARLSFMGLPCPNLCTGGENFHGRHEFACVDDMNKIKDVVLTIIENVQYIK